MNENVMMMRKAKQQLAGHWGEVAVGTLIYLAIMAVASSTTVAELLVFGPLTFGYVLYISCIADTRINNFNLLFRGFERFVETLVAGLLVSLAVGLGYVLLIVPGIIVGCGLSMTFYIMADDPNISGIDAISRSWEMMKGHKWDFFCLQFRFIGWIILGIITCGIAMIWVEPYMTAANLNFYRRLRYGTY